MLYIGEGFKMHFPFN